MGFRQKMDGAYANGLQSNPAYRRVISGREIALRCAWFVRPVSETPEHSDKCHAKSCAKSPRFQRLLSHFLPRCLTMVFKYIQYKSVYFSMTKKVEGSTCIYPSFRGPAGTYPNERAVTCGHDVAASVLNVIIPPFVFLALPKVD